MRLRPALAAASLLTALACADAPPPTAISADATASRAIASTAVCEPSEVVGTITTLYPPTLRGLSIQRFQRARVLGMRRGPDAAWPGFLALAADVIAREAADELLDPPGPQTAAEGATRLVDQLYVCGGREPIGDVLGGVLESGVDVAITTVAPEQPTRLVVPSRNFGVVDETGGFFDEPALLVLERIPDEPPFLPATLVEHPPRYRALVLPASAQTNFGTVPGPGSPSILVIICPAEPHPSLDDLTLLRVPDDFPATDAQVLDAEPVLDPDVTCSEVDPYPVAIGAESGIGGRVFGALRRAGSAAFGWLAPEPLYAVDGGIGGRTFFMSSFVAVGRPGPAPGEDVVVINDMNVFDDRAMADPNNVRLVQNLVGFSTSGVRAGATRVLYDRGREAPCFLVSLECADANQGAFDAAVAGAGFTITKIDAVQSYADVPDDVKVIFLVNPTVPFTSADVEGLRDFAREGGRIVFLGEYVGFYGTAGVAVQNALLQALGTGMTSVGAEIDCAYLDGAGALQYPTLGAASIRPHQTTAGMTGLTVACLSQVVLGPDDYAIVYDATNSIVVAGVAKIDLTPPVVAHGHGGPAPSLRRQGEAATPAFRPTVDGAGRPLGAPR